MHRPRRHRIMGRATSPATETTWPRPSERQDMRHTRGAPYHPMTQGNERWHQTLNISILLENDPARRSRSSDRCIRRVLQPPALSREHRQSHPGRRLTSGAVKPSCWKEKDQTQDHPKPSVASPQTSRVTSTMMRQALSVRDVVLKISDDGQLIVPTIERRSRDPDLP